MKQTIPVFYACDDSFVKYTIVSLSSMIKNASNGYDYRVYILHTEISEDMKKRTLELENEDFHISFINVSDRLEKISEKLPVRDYYSKTTYYRFFISEMFPEYKKAIPSVQMHTQILHSLLSLRSVPQHLLLQGYLLPPVPQGNLQICLHRTVLP